LVFVVFCGKLNVEVKVLSMEQSGEPRLSSPLAFAEGLFICKNSTKTIFDISID